MQSKNNILLLKWRRKKGKQKCMRFFITGNIFPVWGKYSESWSRALAFQWQLRCPSWEQGLVDLHLVSSLGCPVRGDSKWTPLQDGLLGCKYSELWACLVSFFLLFLFFFFPFCTNDAQITKKHTDKTPYILSRFFKQKQN